MEESSLIGIAMISRWEALGIIRYINHDEVVYCWIKDGKQSTPMGAKIYSEYDNIMQEARFYFIPTDGKKWYLDEFLKV